MVGGTKIKFQLVSFTFGAPALLGLSLFVLILHVSVFLPTVER